MKLPNGYGSVYKLPGNRRRPWTARITLSCSKDPQGNYHYKYRYLGYYSSQTEGLTALAHYNEASSVHKTNARKITFSEVFDMWSLEHYPKISSSNIRGYNASYALCDSIDSMYFDEIRRIHLQRIVDTCGKNYPSLKKLKVLFTSMYKFALENDICTKDYAQYVDIHQYKSQNPNSLVRQPFSRSEIETLWAKQEVSEYASVILMLIYSGCRISELLNLKKQNVNIDERWFDVIASKTESGIRKVPIANRVLPLFQYWMDKNDSEYLLSSSDALHFTYQNYYFYYWKPLMEQLGMSSHRPHDTRHTCISLLTAAGIDERIIKRIVGHKGHSITEIVYTHFDIDQLFDAINKI